MMAIKSISENRILTAAGTVIILLWSWMKFAQHELWKDEWQAWFVAKDKSLPEIFSFLYYEGHPALWYLYLKIFTFIPSLTGIPPEYVIMSAHLMMTAAFLYVFFFRMKLTWYLKVMAALSYFMFFEYGVVSRGYALVILFTFLLTSELQKEHSDDKKSALYYFLLCQTEVYGAFMAMALLFYKIRRDGMDLKKGIPAYVYGLMAGLGIFTLSVFPRTAGHVASTQPNAPEYFYRFLNSFQGNLTNTFAIGSTPDTGAYGWSGSGLFIGIIILTALYRILGRDKKILWTGIIFLGMMLLFGSFFFSGGVRQWGMTFIFFLALLSIVEYKSVLDKIAVRISMVIFTFALVHNARAVYYHFSIPFTNAREAGHFIRDNVPEKVPVVGINKFEITPVVGYAGRPFYELPDGVPFTYFRWVDKIYLPNESELRLFTKYKNVGGIVIISPKLLDAGRFPNAQLWKSFDQENYKKENYYLYSLPLK